MPESTVRVEENPEKNRYEIFVDDRIAGFAEYSDAMGQRVMFHTEVDSAFNGQGVGGKLAAAALDDIRAKGMKVVPTCPFISGYIDRHPEYADLLRQR
ncbi:MAG: N-acetyltransferase [Dehalococcoidia bacterium]|nr:N-acetyltransferase [Dehalococcoidia bacterium]